MTDATNNPAANFSGFPGGYNPMTMMSQIFGSMGSGTPPSFPGMTPASYGPAHSALSSALSNALNAQASGGLLGQANPASMGLLSTHMQPAQAVGMTNKGGGQLGADQYYRLTPEFWGQIAKSVGGDNMMGSFVKGNPIYDMLFGAGMIPTMRTPTMYGNIGGSGRSTAGPDGSAYGIAGGGLSDQGQRDLSQYGGIF